MDGWMGTLSDTYEEEYFTSREAMDRSDIIGKTDQITCPTLLMHGMYDDACPVSHSQIVFRELRARGVPTEMVRENGFVLPTTAAAGYRRFGRRCDRCGRTDCKRICSIRR